MIRIIIHWAGKNQIPFEGPCSKQPTGGGGLFSKVWQTSFFERCFSIETTTKGGWSLVFFFLFSDLFPPAGSCWGRNALRFRV